MTLDRNSSGGNIWMSLADPIAVKPEIGAQYSYNVLDSENEVGKAMLGELLEYAAQKSGDINIVLLGGRGAQAMYRRIERLIPTGELDDLLPRLNVFTQDALAPMRMNNSLSFVRDFERLLGPEFFKRIKSFTPMQTETGDVEAALVDYVEKLHSVGGIDIFFLGLGPEAEDASHLCYIKPGSGASFNDLVGIIPISPTILEHHISKFKAGGMSVPEADEFECRNAASILTLGPAAILTARRIVQSIVDADTAPAKKGSFRRLIETKLSADPTELARQADENPGLLVRLHNDVRTYVLPDLIS